MTLDMLSTAYPSHYIGIDAAFNRYFSSADFKELPGVPNCCPRFSEGNADNFSYSFFYSYYLTDYYKINFSVGFANLKSNFTSYEQEIFGFDNGIIEGEFRHDVNAEIKTLSFSPSISYTFSNFNLNLGFGASFFLDKNYSQQEVITKPSDRGTFLDSNGKDTGSRIRNSNSGTLNISNNVLFSVIPVVSYQMPLNSERTLILEPKIGLEYFVNNISSELKWKTINFFGGISLSISLDNPLKDFPIIPVDSIKPLPFDTLLSANYKKDLTSELQKIINPEYITIPDTFVTEKKIFSRNDSVISKSKVIIEFDTMVITKQVKIRRKTYRFDTLKTVSPDLFVEMELYPVSAKSGDIPVNKITFNEISINRGVPLLNFIFYDDNQVEIPDNFNKNGTLNHTEYSNNSEIDIYNNLLNIIGHKLKDNPEQFITLKVSLGVDSKADENLLSQRADNIKNYLSKNWNINHSRILTQYDTIPQKKLKEAAQKNISDELRKVEIIANDDMLKPHYFVDTIIYSSPDLTKLSLKNINNSNIKSWKLDVFLDDNLIKSFSGKDTLPEFIEFDFENIISYLNDTSSHITFKFRAESNHGKLFNNELVKLIDVNKIEKKIILNQKDPEYHKYNLILFDFNSYELSKRNKELINNIKKNITKNSIVEITGYTDELGNPSYNRELSEKRAREVAKLLNIGEIKIKGAGTQEIINGKVTPASRYYSRSVEIFIRTDK